MATLRGTIFGRSPFALPMWVKPLKRLALADLRALVANGTSSSFFRPTQRPLSHCDMVDGAVQRFSANFADQGPDLAISVEKNFGRGQVSLSPCALIPSVKCGRPPHAGPAAAITAGRGYNGISERLDLPQGLTVPNPLPNHDAQGSGHVCFQQSAILLQPVTTGKGPVRPPSDGARPSPAPRDAPGGPRLADATGRNRSPSCCRAWCR